MSPFYFLAGEVPSSNLSTSHLLQSCIMRGYLPLAAHDKVGKHLLYSFLTVRDSLRCGKTEEVFIGWRLLPTHHDLIFFSAQFHNLLLYLTGRLRQLVSLQLTSSSFFGTRSTCRSSPVVETFN